MSQGHPQLQGKLRNVVLLAGHVAQTWGQDGFYFNRKEENRYWISYQQYVPHPFSSVDWSLNILWFLGPLMLILGLEFFIYCFDLPLFGDYSSFSKSAMISSSSPLPIPPLPHTYSSYGIDLLFKAAGNMERRISWLMGLLENRYPFNTEDSKLQQVIPNLVGKHIFQRKKMFKFRGHTSSQEIHFPKDQHDELAQVY